jgi:hypothetical protein
VTLLRELFPELQESTCSEKLARKEVPVGAEAWFAFPRWQCLAPTYEEAVERVFALLGTRRRFSNRLQGRLGPQFLREMERSEYAWNLIVAQQPDSDILVVPVQAGLRHRGRSARRARAMMDAHEFGLGTFAAGVLLLLSPERMGGANTLMMDCCGDQYSLLGDGHFNRVPLYDMELGGLEFSMFYEERARALWAAPTAFVVEPPRGQVESLPALGRLRS